MHTILTLLHRLVSAYPVGVELVVTGILAFGWILGRTGAEYAETLTRSSAGGRLVAGLCGPPTMLLGLSLLIDSVWFQNYARVLLLGELLIGMLVVAAICQRIGQFFARQHLLEKGYEHPSEHILPKQRGS